MTCVRIYFFHYIKKFVSVCLDPFEIEYYGLVSILIFRLILQSSFNFDIYNQFNMFLLI